MAIINKKTVSIFVLVFSFAIILNAQKPIDNQYSTDFRKALVLYENGMFSEASLQFGNIFSQYKDERSKAYSVLCEEYMLSPGYENSIFNFSKKYPYSGILPDIYYKYALNLFDKENYIKSAEYFDKVNPDNIQKKKRAEYLFKRAYCDYQVGDYDSALYWFEKVDLLTTNDYSAPARYALGFIYYERKNFGEALKWFYRAEKDPRFQQIAKYYIVECKFMLKDYKYVTDHAEELYSMVPEDRKPHLARIISESYLILGEPEKAKVYYDTFRNKETKNREDLFYAGSLLYALKDYSGAIEKFSQMKDRTDSLGQIANYQMAYSYIKNKNKVGALEAFKQAATVGFDKSMQEDAFFNYAKLCFDLNKDGSVFKKYIKTYNNIPKNDLLYSYIALADLYDHNYAGAVEAYDNVSDLDKDMTNNYMKANYLRANNLVKKGAYRDAATYLKIAAYYSDKYSTFNHLSRYWLGESYYRDEKYNEALKVFMDLYNISALNGKPEGELIPYNMGYCYYNQGDYDNAVKWFNEYIKESYALNKKDAMTRIADCYFSQKDYGKAAGEYEAANSVDSNPNDIYPYLQSGIAYGLDKNVDKKIELLSNVNRAEPNSPLYADAMTELAKTYISVKENDKAMSCYVRLKDANVDSLSTARALLGLGLLENNKSNYEQALHYYKDVVNIAPKTTYSDDALLAIESIYQTMQDPQEYVSYIDSIGDLSNKTEADKEGIFLNSAEQMVVSQNYDKALVTLKSFVEKYPDNPNINKAEFYIAESYKNLGKKEQACDYYKKVMNDNNGTFSELAALNYAQISEGLERYSDAYSGYEKLEQVAHMDENKKIAIIGMMNSSYRAKKYEDAIHCADNVLTLYGKDKGLNTDASYIKAQSLLATSDRKAAYDIFKQLARYPKTDKGAEASYMIIKDNYDKGLFDNVIKDVYKFAKTGQNQKYWLAKSFILLGDSFVEKGDYKQARATFESIRDGYIPSKGNDEIHDNVVMRLRKLSEMGK